MKIFPNSFPIHSKSVKITVTKTLTFYKLLQPLLSSCINYPACHTPFLCNIHKDLINWKTHKRTHRKKKMKLDVTSKKQIESVYAHELFGSQENGKEKDLTERSILLQSPNPHKTVPN